MCKGIRTLQTELMNNWTGTGLDEIAPVEEINEDTMTWMERTSRPFFCRCGFSCLGTGAALAFWAGSSFFCCTGLGGPKVGMFASCHFVKMKYSTSWHHWQIRLDVSLNARQFAQICTAASALQLALITVNDVLTRLPREANDSTKCVHASVLCKRDLPLQPSFASSAHPKPFSSLSHPRCNFFRRCHS